MTFRKRLVIFPSLAGALLWTATARCAMAASDSERIDFLLREARLVTGVAHGKPKANWIWADKTSARQTCYFQRAVEIAKTPSEAWLYVRGDNSAKPFVNSQPIRLKATPGARSWSFLSAPVTRTLHPGVNTISIECSNSDGPAGLIAILEMRHGHALSRVPTDATWRVTGARPMGWPGSVRAQWIWGHRTRDNQTCYFQRVVRFAATPTAARLYARGDDRMTLFVNGKRVRLFTATGARGYWLMSAPVTRFLRAADNVISVACTNGIGPGGLIAILDARVGGRIVQVATDASWLVNEQRPKAWPAVSAREGGGWREARVLGPAGMRPWGRVAGYPVCSLDKSWRVDEEWSAAGSDTWQTARVLGSAGVEPWGEVGGYPAPYLPKPQPGMTPRMQVEMDWLTQDRRALRHGRGAVGTYATLALTHLERAEALIREIGAMRNAPDLSVELAEAREIKTRFVNADGSELEGFRAYLAARWLKRRVAFRNPLLDFTDLLFIKQYYPRNYHEQSHRLGRAAIPGGGLYVLSGLSPSGELRRVTGAQLPVGNFWRSDLSFDGKRILFCYKAPKGPVFHIYEIGADGTGLRQLTSGRFDDLDPIYLSNGKIMFTSTRGLTYVRCNPESRAYVLCTMKTDGSDIKIVSHNNECDWTPCLLPDGHVLYTRWEYTDRALWRLQKLWTTNPDGTGTRIFWGNHSEKPDCLVEARPVPNSSKVVFCGVGHHQFFQGSLGLVDPAQGLDYPLGLTHITPEVAWPEVERDRGAGAYKSPFPLSEKFFVVSYGYDSRAFRPGGADFGIYLLDVFGNRELIYRHPKFNSYYAIPMKPRQRPPVIPEVTAEWAAHDSQGRATGALFNPDVYAGMPGVPRGRVKHLRIIEADYKTYSGNREYLFQCPPISMHFVESVKRVLGTAPVEPDGSVFFKMPTGKSVYFQLLDESYMAVQTMRSFVGVQPGEVRGCSGCHEGNGTTPVDRTGKALLREPAEITPPPWGEATIGYRRFVQPVLDRYCVSCHSPAGQSGRKLDLTFRKTKFFGEPYETLIAKQIAYVFPSEPAYWKRRARDVYTVARPLEYLSVKSKLISNASTGRHHGVKVDATSLRQLIAWIDCNGPYYGLEEVRKRFPNAPVSVRP